MKYLRYIFIFLVAFLLTNNVSKAEEEIILFLSDTNEESIQIVETIEEKKLNKILNILIVEVNDDNFEEITTELSEDCDWEAGRDVFPTLYYNEECTTGVSNITNTLDVLAETASSNEEDESQEIIDENDEEDIKKSQEEEKERTLDEVVDIQEKPEPEKRPFYHYIIMVIGPALFLGLGYFMIKKLNL